MSAPIYHRFQRPRSSMTPELRIVYNDIRDAALTFAEHLDTLCPASRELDLALTNIEQAMFWANAAIARRSPEADAPAG